MAFYTIERRVARIFLWLTNLDTKEALSGLCRVWSEQMANGNHINVKSKYS